MSTFADELIAKYTSSTLEDRFPIWKWKMTDEDYQSLKEYLKQQIYNFTMLYNPEANAIERFYRAIGREVVIYYSEFWRREYNGETQKEQAAFDALGVANTSNNVFQHFKDSAKYGYPKNTAARVRPGWERLGMQVGVDIYRSNTQTREILSLAHSLFFQGGMPMGCILNGTSDRWRRFVDNLLADRVNYDELDMTIVANYVSGPRDFCQQLKYAFEENREAYHAGFPSEMKPELMPFHCQSHTDDWFVGIMQKCILSSNRIEERGTQPFQLKWMVDCSNDDRQISYFYYRIITAGRLSANFTRIHNLQNQQSQSFLLQEGAQSVFFRTFNANERGQLVANTLREHIALYNGNTIVSIVSQESGEVIIQRELDLTRPVVAIPERNGQYAILKGNSIARIGSAAFRLFLPQNWQLDTKIEGSQSEERNCNDGRLTMQMLFIPAGDHSQGFVLRNTVTNETIVYSSSIEEKELVVCDPDFGTGSKYWAADKTPLYSSAQGYFELRCGETAQRVNIQDLEFSSYEDSVVWHREIPTGRIMARYRDANGVYIYSDRFINVTGLSCACTNERADKCEMNVTWDGFDPEVEGGKRLIIRNQPTWVVNREQLSDQRSIEVTMLHMDTHRTVKLRYKAPFREISIFDPVGKKLERFCPIPLIDLSSYTYRITDTIHSIMIIIKTLTEGRTIRVLNNQNRLMCEDQDTRKTWSLAPEGPLTSLLHFEDKVPVECNFTMGYVGNRHPFQRLTIRNFPYFLHRHENRIIFTCSNPYRQDENAETFKEEIEYTRPLQLMDVSNPQKKYSVFYDPDNGHVIDETLMQAGGEYIVVGEFAGHIRPRYEDLSMMPETTQERRAQNAQETEARLQCTYSQCKLFDPQWESALSWYQEAISKKLHAKYFLDLKIIGSNPQCLAKFIWQLWITASDEAEKREIIRNFWTIYQPGPEGDVMNHPFIQAMNPDIISSLAPTNNKTVEDILDKDSDFFQLRFKQWRMDNIEADDLSALAFAQQIWQKLDELSKNWFTYAQ